MKYKIILLTLATMGLLCSSVKAGEPEKNWEVEFLVSYLNSDGNSNNENFNGEIGGHYDWTKYTLRGGFRNYHSKTNKHRTAESYELKQKLEAIHKKAYFMFQEYIFDKDSFAGIDARNTIGVGYGQRVKKDDLVYLLETSARIIWKDEVDGDSDNFGALRGYGEAKKRILKASFLGGGLELIKDFETHNAYRINAHAYARTYLTYKLQLQFKHEVKYNHAPSPGFKSKDNITTFSVAWKI